jgi:peroxiredoxin
LVIAMASLMVLGATAVGCNKAEPDLSSGLGLVIDCDQNPAEGLEAGDRALDFRFEDAVGNTFSLSDYRGRSVVLHFWSTACDHCLGEIIYIKQVYDEWPDEELVVVTIEVFGEAESVNTFLTDNSVSLPVLLDEEFEVMEQYGVDIIPRTFFIDREGLIRGIKFGSLESREELEDILEQLIALQEEGG